MRFLSSVFSRFLTIGLLLVLASPGQAQERAAGNATDLQMTWAALAAKADTALNHSKLVNFKVEQMLLCNNKGMIYAPKSGDKDSQGCASVTATPSKEILGCNKIGKLWDGTTCKDVDLTLLNQIYNCNKDGKFWNGKQCTSPGAPEITVDYDKCTPGNTETIGNRGEAGRRLGMKMNSFNYGYLYCPKGYVQIGSNDGEVGNILCCSLKAK